jgi:HlyD family secretion protein
MWSTGGRSVRVSRHRAQQQEGQGRIFGRWQNPVALRAARGVVAILLVASGVVACTTTTAPPRPNTAPVQRTSITSGVSATGSLTAITEQNIGFVTGGQLTAVNVKVGDRVTAGQVLATIDPFAAQQALDQARGQLRTQQANLDRLNNSPLSSGSQDTLDQAQKILDKTKAQADAQNDAAETAVDNARRALSQAKKQLDKAEDAKERPPARAALPRRCSRPAARRRRRRTCPHAHHADRAHSSGPSRACTSAQVRRHLGQERRRPPRRTTSTRRSSSRTSPRRAGRLAVANAAAGVVSAQNALDQALVRPAVQHLRAGRAGHGGPGGGGPGAARAGRHHAAGAGRRHGVGRQRHGRRVRRRELGHLARSRPAPTPPCPARTGRERCGRRAGRRPPRPGRGGTQFLVLDNVDEFQVVMAYTET